MVQKISYFIFKNDGTFIDAKTEDITASSNFTNKIYFISGVDAGNSIVASMYLNGKTRKINQQRAHLYRDTSGKQIKAKDFIDGELPYFQMVKDYNVWELEISEYTLSSISKRTAGYIHISFGISEVHLDPNAIRYMGTFGNISSTLEGDLPHTAEVGDYYTCNVKNYYSSRANRDVQYKEAMYWDGNKWVHANSYNLILTTDAEEISVNPAVSGKFDGVVAPDITDAILSDISQHESELADISERVDYVEDVADLITEKIVTDTVYGSVKVYSHEHTLLYGGGHRIDDYEVKVGDEVFIATNADIIGIYKVRPGNWEYIHKLKTNQIVNIEEGLVYGGTGIKKLDNGITKVIRKSQISK